LRIEFNDREHLGWQHNPVSVNRFEAFEKGAESLSRHNGQRLFLARWCRILQGEQECSQFAAVVRVKMAEKEVGDVKYGDTDFQQAAHDPRPAVEKQVFPTGFDQK
jgi:hypothetical protein